MQRYHAEITARQALMLGEAARMQGLMEAYKQRDQLYVMQMAEARGKQGQVLPFAQTPDPSPWHARFALNFPVPSIT